MTGVVQHGLTDGVVATCCCCGHVLLLWRAQIKQLARERAHARAQQQKEAGDAEAKARARARLERGKLEAAAEAEAEAVRARGKGEFKPTFVTAAAAAKYGAEKAEREAKLAAARETDAKFEARASRRILLCISANSW